ncbi:YEATS domain-containing protein 2 [Aethina tumida]|uniref:YEATS domain-containing protein 2 n=1 Tax=Aethina tumida TaxID=116153 RepID=UPI0021494DA9|nr:YEATS domain-containing protein 2 [Aethina tumida]
MEFNYVNTNADPDYEAHNSAIRRAELNQTEDSKDSVEECRKIIKDVFDQELASRRKHLEDIENQIFKAQKLLHLVRYALVTQYYNNKSLEPDPEECEDNNVMDIDGQNRIHRAVKKLLIGNSPQILNRNKRKAKNLIAPSNSTTAHNTTKEQPAKKIKLEDPVSLLPKIVPNSTNVRNRKKVKQRIIIGNISKYTHSREDNDLTHKWMIFVRGPKEKPDVSSFIQRVVFYLHPSYKPYDVVEVSEPPFQLARRGWGEFPIRVQIFFKNTMNKPVDLVHNLKLDQKHTGRQCLGNETIVDLYLHDENDPMDSHLDDLIKKEIGDSTDIVIKDELLLDDVDQCDITFGNQMKSEDVNSLNNDPYFGDVLASNLNDHNYSLHHSFEGINIKPDIEDLQPVNPDTPLVYGLEDYMHNGKKYGRQSLSPKKSIDASVDKKSPVKSPTIKMLTNSLGQNVYLISNGPISNRNVFMVKGKHPQSILKTDDVNKLVQEKINYNEFKIKLPPNKFKNMGEVLPYLFKKLPLHSKLADNLNYKCTYPFTALSLKEYASFNVGKKLSTEWSRAKTIRKILQEHNFFESHKWNTKAILMYGRCHIYTPLTTFSIFNYDSDEKNLVLNTYKTSLRLPDTNLAKYFKEDENIDVLQVNKQSPVEMKSAHTQDISDETLRLPCSFVRQTALESGVVLKSEEILPNVYINGAERMILAAVKCLAENLMRRASCHLICEGNYDESTSQVLKTHVQMAINERREIRNIKDFHTEKRELEFFM